MATINLSVNKPIVRGGEEVIITADYSGYAGEDIQLVRSDVFPDEIVGNGITGQDGKVSFAVKPDTQGTFTFYAVHSYLPDPLPGGSPCGFWCDQSNTVSISVEEGTAPCDPWDIGCRITPSFPTKAIIGVAAVAVALGAVWFFSKPKAYQYAVENVRDIGQSISSRIKR